MFTHRLEVCGHRVDAVSVGGVETCYRLPRFRLNLDIGRCPPGAEREPTLLLTHAHIDHAAGLPYYVSMRGMMSAPPPTVYCPAHDRDALWAILKGWAGLQADADRCELIGVTPGERIPLGKSTCAQTFRSPHRISTLGYTLMRTTRRLKPELRGRTEAEIAEIARAGHAVQDEHEVAEICFPGDTTADVVDREPTVTTARVLLLECTFVGDDVGPERARKSGHVHLDEIAARADRFENEAIVLTHFSRRYSAVQIAERVRAALPEDLLERVTLLTDQSPSASSSASICSS